MLDLEVMEHGTVGMIRPASQVGREWLKENVQAEGWQWLGGALACEPRMTADLVEGARADGLAVG